MFSNQLDSLKIIINQNYQLLISSVRDKWIIMIDRFIIIASWVNLLIVILNWRDRFCQNKRNTLSMKQEIFHRLIIKIIISTTIILIICNRCQFNLSNSNQDSKLISNNNNNNNFHNTNNSNIIHKIQYSNSLMHRYSNHITIRILTNLSNNWQFNLNQKIHIVIYLNRALWFNNK